jgi:hypothetical protein
MNNCIKPRWADATNELISKLENQNVNFNSLNTLEMFGRGGDWHTTIFQKKVKTLEVWEIDPKWKNELKKNLPNATIKIRDTIKTIKNEKNFMKYDLILIDNPMNTYGPKLNDSDPGMYCEHFDVINHIDNIIDKQAIVVFNVNRKPFDYDKFPVWKKRREKFYGNTNTSDMKIDFLLKFYKKFFQELGFDTIFHENVVRVINLGIDITHYFTYKIKRN